MTDGAPSGPPGASARILVVEDDEAISDVVATALRHHGHATTQVDRGDDGFLLAVNEPFDLVVLDVNLPGLDGYEACRRLRDAGRQVPVLFLTARDETPDRVTGFRTGGDDYLTKPFSVDELALRVEAILRRTRSTGSEQRAVLRVGDLVLDLGARVVHRAGRPVDLSPTEMRLLEHLMANAGVVLSKEQILDVVWADGDVSSPNVVELYVSYLRRKLDGGGNELIRTRRGLGYVLRKP